VRVASGVLILLVMAAPAQARLLPEWRYADPTETTKTYAMAVDPDGRVYLAGSIQLAADGKAQAIIRFLNNKGAVDWTVSVLGTGGATPWEDGARSIVYDAASVTLVAGGTRWTGPNHQADAWLARYIPCGGVTWSRTVLATAYCDAIYGVAVAPNGNIYAAGRRGNSKGNGDLWVGRFDWWGNQISTPLIEPNILANDDAALSITVDPTGAWVFVGGFRSTAANGKDVWVARYSSDLNPAAPGTWRTSYNGPASATDYAAAVALDPSGSVWVTGAVTVAHSIVRARKDIFVAKLDGTTGTVIWSRTVDGGQNADDEGLALSMDPGGTCYVSGYVNRPGADDNMEDMWMARYLADGTTVWQEALAGVGNDLDRNDRAAGFVSDGAGGYYIAGTMVDQVFGRGMFASHIGDFPAIQATAPVIGRAHPVPNPFRPGSTGAYAAPVISFLELSPGASVRIYTLAGELVAELTDLDRDGMESWDAKNKGGRDLASGIYLYAVKPETGPVVRGKVVIIR
jgi:hypothetical protein